MIAAMSASAKVQSKESSTAKSDRILSKVSNSIVTIELAASEPTEWDNWFSTESDTIGATKFDTWVSTASGNWLRRSLLCSTAVTPNWSNWFAISFGLRCTLSRSTSLWTSIAANTYIAMVTELSDKIATREASKGAKLRATWSTPRYISL